MIKVGKRVLRLIGPYPFNPRLIFIILTSFYFSRFIPLVLSEPPGVARAPIYLSIFIAAAIPSSAYAIGAYLLERYRSWSSDGLLHYLLEVTGLQVIFFTLLPFSKHLLQRLVPSSHDLILPLNPLLFLTSLSFALFSFALSHGSERRISDRLHKADKLVQKLEMDSRKLVLSDEALRRQTSQFLHDKVQSELMVIAMELKGAQGQASIESDAAISRAIDRLESTRTIDIRNLVQILTPNFEDAKLTSSIHLLQRQYADSLSLSVSIDPEVDSMTENQQLGLFRIMEQCLLNALVHGPAKKVAISIAKNSQRELLMSIEDDGPGVILSGVKSGVGTAVIDSWLNILNGKSEIITSPGRGYRFTAHFPI